MKEKLLTIWCYLFCSILIGCVTEHPEKSESDLDATTIASRMDQSSKNVVQKIIYFESGKAKSAEETRQQISELNREFQSQQISSIRVSGHTDASGSAADNLALSELRAADVRINLIDNGIPSAIITSEAHGETEPFVHTGDGVIEQLNNRVELIIEVDSKLNKCQKDGYSSEPLFAINGEIEQDFECVSVLYGTNRERNIINQNEFDENPYGPVLIAPEASPTYGELIVTIPAKHRPGRKIKVLPEGAKPTQKKRRKFFTLWNWSEEDELSVAEFASRAKRQLSLEGPYSNQAFIFIHGYNVDFRSAAFRTAQIKSDIEFDGPAFFFSWPSNSEAPDYLSDQDDADASVKPLLEFMQTVRASLNNDTKIHVISHSMGNRVFAQALNQLSNLSTSSSKNFETLIFAHADVDDRLFKQWVIEPNSNKDKTLFSRGILYTTNDDKPLGLSNLIRSPFGTPPDEKYRVGLSGDNGPYSVYGENYTTVDLSEMRPNILSHFFGTNHSKYVENLAGICHIGQLFRGENVVPIIPNGQFATRLNQKEEEYIAMTNFGWSKKCDWGDQ